MKTKATIGIGAAGLVAAALLAALVLGVGGEAHAQGPDGYRARPTPKAQRAPTRIIVRPVLRNRHDASEFPRADNLGFPGQNAVRQCVSWLAPDHRFSGNVVTPQMRCWWER